MLQIVSPAKTLDFSPIASSLIKTNPIFVEQANSLVKHLQTFSQEQLQSILEISPKLATLNYERYKTWQDHATDESKQAGYAFKGDVYIGLDIETMSSFALQKLNRGLRILSGLYGVLQPSDGILPHRLEMSTPLETSKSKNLYEYWSQTITNHLRREIQTGNHAYLINLASQEYAKAVDFKKIEVPIIQCEFKDYKNGKLKMISFFAKKARGMMARYIAEHDVTEPEHLIGFDYGGYTYSKELSNKHSYVFTR